jgi:hypothetical protein
MCGGYRLSNKCYRFCSPNTEPWTWKKNNKCCFAGHTAIGCNFSSHVCFILFVYRCEVCGQIQLRTCILRYCILVGRIKIDPIMLLSLVLLGCRCELCSTESGMWRYERIHTVGIECHVFRWTEGVRPFYSKGPHRLLWVGWGVACGKISAVRHRLNYCGLCPPVAAPCRKQNCTLYRSLGTLQLSRATIIFNVFSVAVL